MGHILYSNKISDRGGQNELVGCVLRPLIWTVYKSNHSGMYMCAAAFYYLESNFI